jgi:uroporphyrinogen-III synthase
MKDLTKMFESLKLFYYEYDKYNNKFVKDQDSQPDAVYNDFIKLTYELSKQHIGFFVDENSDVVISQDTGMFKQLKHKVQNMKDHISNSSKNIYILSDKHVEYAKNIPLINTVTIKSEIDLDSYSAIVFTSKNGVKHLNAITQKWKSIPSYAISTQTAKEIKKYGGKLAYVGKEKHGDKFAKELLEIFDTNAKVAYIGAKDVVSNIESILNENGVKCDHIPVYETVCVEYDEKIDLPDDSKIIFSSPSTVKCFFKNVEWKDTFKAISIGDTTKKYFPKEITPVLSDNTTLQSCVQKALNL